MNIQDLTLAVLPIVNKYGVQVSMGALAVAIGLRHVLKLRKKSSREAEVRHHRMEASASRVLFKIKQMVPLQNPGQVFSYLRQMNPYAFEEMILHELEHRGLKIQRNKAYSGDGGIDGKFYLDGKLWLVQAKRYKEYVKKEHVWAFDAVCKENKARGVFVHTGKTPKDLLALERQCGVVRIISGNELMQLFSGHAVDLRLPTEIAAARAAEAIKVAAPPSVTPATVG